MVDDRRTQLADAGLGLLATDGLRGLTHRAIDRVLDLPEGTCSNSYRTRAALLSALAERIFVRLTPDEAYVAARLAEPPSRAQWTGFMVDLVERALAAPELHLALWELRLESTRRPELVAPLTATLRTSFDHDVEVLERSGLPGGEREIVLLHAAINGLILGLITLPDVLRITDVAATVDDIVARIVYRQN